MRAYILFFIALALACLLGSCRTAGISADPSGSSIGACLQCNVVCCKGSECPVCKGVLKRTEISRACPRCGKPCGRTCGVCGLDSVPALQYFKCPNCGRTQPCSGGDIGRYGTGAGLPVCPNCRVRMLGQSVPLRGFCPDCGIWSERAGPCPRCGLDMAPM